MASCILLKKSTMNKPLPADPDPNANPGEFALVDHEDGSLTLAIVDPAGNPSPIDAGAATITVASGMPNVVEVDTPKGFTWHERVSKGVTSSPKSPTGKGIAHATAKKKAPGSGAVADMSLVVTWTDGSASHKLTWKDTVVNDPAGAAIERGPVTVSEVQ